jgi:hypothetical protein
VISGTEAVNVLLAVNKGTYTEHKYSTIVRDFKPSYVNNVPGFNREQLFNKVLAPYVSHEWINK